MNNKHDLTQLYNFIYLASLLLFVGFVIYAFFFWDKYKDAEELKFNYNKFYIAKFLNFKKGKIKRYDKHRWSYRDEFRFEFVDDINNKTITDNIQMPERIFNFASNNYYLAVDYKSWKVILPVRVRNNDLQQAIDTFKANEKEIIMRYMIDRNFNKILNE